MTTPNPFAGAPGSEEEDVQKPYASGTIDTADPRSLDDEFDWRTKFRTDAVTAVERWSDKFGIDRFALDAYVRSNTDAALQHITRRVIMPNRESKMVYDPTIDAMKQVDMGGWKPSTPSDWQQIWDAGIDFFSMGIGFDLQQDIDGGGGGGSRGPTADDIRNMYDEDQLTNAATEIWQGYLWEDPTHARKMAREYIDTMVSTLGQQEVDFETFIRTKAEQTSRWKTLYRNKPEGVDPRAYVQPYARAAVSMVGGAAGASQTVSDLVAGGAALGASADAFGNRLARTDANRNSGGFVQGLENGLSEINGILRG